MAGQSDQPPQSGVPDLIERYRVRRDAWIAQADELARLRDEVRASAEREAMEIVTAARRDVRKVITEARRELLVLSAQVQAALGEATPKTDPATLLNKAGITLEPGARNLLAGTATDALVSEDVVNEILNDVQDDMTALAEDARTLPLQAVPSRQIAAPVSRSSIPDAITAPPMRVVPSIASSPSITAQPPSPPQTSIAAPPIQIPEITFPPPDQERDEIPGLSESASKVLLSSPFPSDAVPIQNDKRLRTFLALFVGIGAMVALVTTWWLSSGNSASESSAVATSAPREASAPSAAGQPPPAPTAATKASAAPGEAPSTANLSLMVEAVREVWIRTTIDGRTDDGRTLATGQGIEISAEQSILVRAGDAGAVLVSVNNGEKRLLGRDGQVMTRRFVAERADEPVRAPAPPVAPAPQPAPAPLAPSAPARVQPPVASAAPAPAPPVTPPPSAPSSAGSVARANPPSPPAPTASAPSAAPAPAVSQQTSSASQVSIPSGVGNQLSAPAAPLAAPAEVPTPPSPATVVVAVARQWLDAYHRQDRATMAALSTENLLLADERRADERFPSGLGDVTRTLDRVSVQIAADTAVLTAVMMEQSASVPSSPHVSPISQVWVLGAGQWKVRQARFVSEARLNQVFK
jgi:hypothetical protein